MEIQETNRKRAIARKQEKAKMEVTLTAAGAPDATRNTLNTATHEEIVSYCQKAINDTSNGPKLTVEGIQKLKSGDIRIRCAT